MATREPQVSAVQYTSSGEEEKLSLLSLGSGQLPDYIKEWLQSLTKGLPV